MNRPSIVCARVSLIAGLVLILLSAIRFHSRSQSG